MKQQEITLLPLFEKFIKDSLKGKRLKADGTKIKSRTVQNYGYITQYLREYEEKSGATLRIRVMNTINKQVFMKEKKYWKKFYLEFTAFLYRDKQCFDNYVGNVIKIIRIFFNYLNKELGIRTGDFHKDFYICREEIPVITLMPAQLSFLMNDKEFEQKLSASLRKSKDILVFGCTVALRVSDLFSVKFTDIEMMGNAFYLPVKTGKTGTVVRIKLPSYAMEIVQRFKSNAKQRRQIFPPVPRTRFNNHLKEIAAIAGWTQETGKYRNKRGKAYEETFGRAGEKYRFCDLVSSHIMRRTAITTMLMLGMKEHIVKQISGHSDNSKSFYRYVNLVQSYMDNEMDLVFDKLANAC